MLNFVAFFSQQKKSNIHNCFKANEHFSLLNCGSEALKFIQIKKKQGFF